MQIERISNELLSLKNKDIRVGTTIYNEEEFYSSYNTFNFYNFDCSNDTLYIMDQKAFNRVIINLSNVNSLEMENKDNILTIKYSVNKNKFNIDIELV